MADVTTIASTMAASTSMTMASGADVVRWCPADMVASVLMVALTFITLVHFYHYDWGVGTAAAVVSGEELPQPPPPPPPLAPVVKQQQQQQQQQQQSLKEPFGIGEYRLKVGVSGISLCGGPGTGWRVESSCACRAYLPPPPPRPRTTTTTRTRTTTTTTKARHELARIRIGQLAIVEKLNLLIAITTPTPPTCAL